MIIVAFHTTADAFGFEEIAKRYGLEGRLGTIPRSISAGCGLPGLSNRALGKIFSDSSSSRDLSAKGYTNNEGF